MIKYLVIKSRDGWESVYPCNRIHISYRAETGSLFVNDPEMHDDAHWKVTGRSRETFMDRYLKFLSDYTQTVFQLKGVSYVD